MWHACILAEAAVALAVEQKTGADERFWIGLLLSILLSDLLTNHIRAWKWTIWTAFVRPVLISHFWSSGSHNSKPRIIALNQDVQILLLGVSVLSCVAQGYILKSRYPLVKWYCKLKYCNLSSWWPIFCKHLVWRVMCATRHQLLWFFRVTHRLRVDIFTNVSWLKVTMQNFYSSVSACKQNSKSLQYLWHCSSRTLWLWWHISKWMLFCSVSDNQV